MSFQCGMLRLRWNLNPGAYCGGTTGIGHFGNRECPCTKMSSEKRASRCWFNQQAPSHSRLNKHLCLQSGHSQSWDLSMSFGLYNSLWFTACAHAIGLARWPVWIRFRAENSFLKERVGRLEEQVQLLAEKIATVQRQHAVLVATKELRMWVYHVYPKWKKICKIGRQSSFKNE